MPIPLHLDALSASSNGNPGTRNGCASASAVVVELGRVSKDADSSGILHEEHPIDEPHLDPDEPSQRLIGNGLKAGSDTLGISWSRSLRKATSPRAPDPAPALALASETRIAVDLCDGPAKLAQTQITAGVGKVGYTVWQNSLNAFNGGAYIAMGGFLMNVIAGGCPGLGAENPGLQKLLAGMVFPIGLVMVVATGAELVTSSFSTVIAAWFAGALRKQNTRTAINLVHVYLLNFLGAFTMALIAYGSMLLASDPYKAYSLAVAEHKVHQEIYTAVIRGIMCNWLVSLAVYLSFAAHDFTGKVMAIWPPIAAFVAMGMDHCVANMFFLPLGFLLGAKYTIWDMFYHNLIPVTVGNIIGSQLVGAYFDIRFNKTFWNTPPPAKMSTTNCAAFKA